jgi:hypothetical protein
MTLDPPRPVITLCPPEQLRAKIDAKLVLALNANSGIDVMGVAREVHAGEGVPQSQSVPGEEDDACAKLVAEANCVTWRDARKTRVIIATAICILKELARVVQMESRAEPVPARKTSRWIWTSS